MIKLDLHTHSIISPDGGLTEAHYKRVLTQGALDCLAITDHNDITFAQMMWQRFGKKIIVGEEITTSEGEMIGLFLKNGYLLSFNKLSFHSFIVVILI